ncbi:transcriptional regulator, MerR family [Thalassoporum mexicanum PCC 7367]|uniref:heavy metal-responsive transcriptional regulator n=1 Tax=Thalassoporum mexicanum TaxID=3457544 RepID=UPI00029FEC14|nr:heavy metal-responsive transcriptional regulator [Pseudanabaena sp. PCC 7367]AFY69250.1 transcriptional regulator, MerR family [Pseudanabaena sp. PCC 7367]
MVAIQPEKKPKLLIGQVQTQSGVSIKTIRYYEEQGLVKACDRTEGGFRLFNHEVIGRLSFIKRSQSLGFKLQEIKQILDIHDRGQMPCHEVRHKIAIKVAEIDRKVAQLQQLKTELLSLVDQNNPGLTVNNENMGDREVICPIIQQ